MSRLVHGLTGSKLLVREREGYLILKLHVRADAVVVVMGVVLVRYFPEIWQAVRAALTALR